MEHYEASAAIDAGTDRVWDVLLDGGGCSTWDSGVEQVEGSIADGAKIKVHSKVVPGLQPSFDTFTSGRKAEAERQ